MNAASKRCRLTCEKEIIRHDADNLFFMMDLFSSFDANPAFFRLDVDGDGGEAGAAEDLFEGFRRRVVEVVVFDVFPGGRAEVGPFVDFGDEQEGAAFFQDASDFFQVFRRIGPEVEAFDGRDFIEAVVGKGQFFDGGLGDVHLAGFYGFGIGLTGGLDGRFGIVDARQVACGHVAVHSLEVGAAAAAYVEDGFIAAPGKVGEAPGCERTVTFIHAGQHLFAGFACRFGRIAGSCDGFFISIFGTHVYHLISKKVDYLTLLYDDWSKKGRVRRTRKMN